MLYPYISQFNWIDILIIICVLRMCYVGLKRGFGIEIFKVINLIFCCFVALHFYYAFAEFLNGKLPVLPLDAAVIFCYVLLICVITILFRILREGFFVLVKNDSINPISKFLGLFLGFIRGTLISSLIIFGLIISTVHYFDLSSRTSFFGPKIVKLPLKIYESIFNNAVAKIFPDQSFNQEIINTLESKPEKD